MDWRRIGPWEWRIEFKPQDMWVGAFWKTEHHVGFIRKTFDIWICVVPMFPIHIAREWIHSNR